VRTRFAPSPTGHIHLGNARTALFNALLAAHAGGEFLLRVEDTDASRSSPVFAEALLRDLRWMGLEWTPTGPAADGAYYQHQRTDLYEPYFRRLQETGLAYPCFCTAQELERARRAQRLAGKPPRYPGTCAALDSAQVAARRARGLHSTLRFRVPSERNVRFSDLVRGEVQFASDDLGDFIIRRADGGPAFLFANAVDDALMDISHVLRGEDHLANTPRQLLLLSALGLEAPSYGHLPLIVAIDGTPLSKREGSVAVGELREEGFLPQAILNYLARLGHHLPEERFLSVTELAARFRIENLSRAPARFDRQQLLHWQSSALNAATTGELWAWMAPAVGELVPTAQRAAFVEALRANLCFPIDAHRWAEILFARTPALGAEAEQALRQAGANFFRAAAAGTASVGEELLPELKRITGVKGKALYHPLRAALTGRADGPELTRILALLGAHEARARLAQAARWLEEDQD
jgi:glutamyl-tRNA synthetase